MPVGPEPRQSSALALAAELLHAGELVVFATETVYGLGARADQAQAVERIYAVKGRPGNNPLIVHVKDAEAARHWSAHWPASARQLAEVFWPGPLTLVVPADERLPPVVRAGRPTVALRVPNHPVAQALLQTSGLPIAAPSANRSGHISPTCAAHVLRSLKQPVGLILDSGPTQIGVESTVLDLTGEYPRLLRPGAITLEQLSAVVGRVKPYLAPKVAPLDDEPAFPSPGMMRKHYAPSATVCLFDPDEWPAVAEEIAQRQAKHEVIGILTRTVPVLESLRHIGLPNDPTLFATKLYAALHDLEEVGCTWLAIEAPPDEPAWQAVNDRLARASAEG